MSKSIAAVYKLKINFLNGVILLIIACPFRAFSQNNKLANNNLIWYTQSKNASESMPCGGGDVGLNVWVENNEVYAYVARSNAFDENNTLLKLGRIKLKISPNPFGPKNFKQELILKDGYVQISGSNGNLTTTINVWVDVFSPEIHFDVRANQKVEVTASFESWRFADRVTKGRENNQNSYKWAPQGVVKTKHDEIKFNNNEISFVHKNAAETVVDVTLAQQKLSQWKDSLTNPLKNVVFGGTLKGTNMVAAGIDEGSYQQTPFKAWKLKSKEPSRTHQLTASLFAQGTEQEQSKHARSWTETKLWWNAYWDRSFVYITANDEEANQVGHNYQLFRYLLGCNAMGVWPTKFNGGLFTYDPVLVDTTYPFTPDFRNWGGGIFTAQNQRLVYWPMLKSGDYDLMKPQFEFYLSLLKTAEHRSQVYWQHAGASFTEQLENFGLPNAAEYGWKRPAGFDPGLEYNAWLEYQWDTVLEFCQMILETERYNGNDIKKYIPLIESCLTFFKEHYTYLAKQRGAKVLDSDGHLVLYPGSAAETYKMAYNSTSTIAALKTVLNSLMASPSITPEKKKGWQEMLAMIPPISYREFGGHVTIAPAKAWARINNTESPQLYPVFPWGMFGLGKPGLDTAINTYQYDADVLKFRSHVGWKQDLIFAARLGLTDEAARLVKLKMKDSGRRYPAFWGPGFDWVPDHNWGGSGMIGLQEMLMQCDGEKILLLPSWPKAWDVHFKLHAPQQTTIECTFKNGKIEELKISPESRRKDVVIW
ncbi:MAG: DUF5703 domain-containing protein [Pedobacter sp.]|nr:DUF5703 domain-containing protein [Pedobacter sp.]